MIPHGSSRPVAKPLPKNPGRHSYGRVWKAYPLLADLLRARFNEIVDLVRRRGRGECAALRRNPKSKTGKSRGGWRDQTLLCRTQTFNVPLERSTPTHMQEVRHRQDHLELEDRCWQEGYLRNRWRPVRKESCKEPLTAAGPCKLTAPTRQRRRLAHCSSIPTSTPVSPATPRLLQLP